MRAEVGSPGLELVVDGEVVDADADQRRLLEHRLDQPIKRHVRLRRAVRRRGARGDDLLELRRLCRAHDQAAGSEHDQRYDDLLVEEPAAVPEQQHHETDSDAEAAAARLGEDHRDQQDPAQAREQPAVMRRPAVAWSDDHCDQEQERQRRHHAEVVGVLREAGQAIDAGLRRHAVLVVRRDDAVQVGAERPGAGEERLQEDRVELDARCRAHGRLQQAVRGADRHAENEGSRDAPPQFLATSRNVRDRADEEQRKDQPLDDALRPLVDALRRVEPEEAAEMHAEQEQDEAEHNAGCSR